MYTYRDSRLLYLKHYHKTVDEDQMDTFKPGQTVRVRKNITTKKGTSEPGLNGLVTNVFPDDLLIIEQAGLEFFRARHPRVTGDFTGRVDILELANPIQDIPFKTGSIAEVLNTSTYAGKIIHSGAHVEVVESYGDYLRVVYKGFGQADLELILPRTVFKHVPTVPGEQAPATNSITQVVGTPKPDTPFPIDSVVQITSGPTAECITHSYTQINEKGKFKVDLDIGDTLKVAHYSEPYIGFHLPGVDPLLYIKSDHVRLTECKEVGITPSYVKIYKGAENIVEGSKVILDPLWTSNKVPTWKFGNISLVLTPDEVITVKSVTPTSICFYHPKFAYSAYLTCDRQMVKLWKPEILETGPTINVDSSQPQVVTQGKASLSNFSNIAFNVPELKFPENPIFDAHQNDLNIVKATNVGFDIVLGLVDDLIVKNREHKQDFDKHRTHYEEFGKLINDVYGDLRRHVKDLDSKVADQKRSLSQVSSNVTQYTADVLTKLDVLTKPIESPFQSPYLCGVHGYDIESVTIATKTAFEGLMKLISGIIEKVNTQETVLATAPFTLGNKDGSLKSPDEMERLFADMYRREGYEQGLRAARKKQDQPKQYEFKTINLQEGKWTDHGDLFTTYSQDGWELAFPYQMHAVHLAMMRREVRPVTAKDVATLALKSSIDGKATTVESLARVAMLKRYIAMQKDMEKSMPQLLINIRHDMKVSPDAISVDLNVADHEWKSWERGDDAIQPWVMAPLLDLYETHLREQADKTKPAVATKILGEGDPCPGLECGGTLHIPLVKGCTCHLGHPPCSNCTNNPIQCDRCDYT